MKKLLTFVVAASLLVAPAFSLDFLPDFFPDISLSAGGGGIFNTHWRDDALRGRYGNHTVGAGGVLNEYAWHAVQRGMFDTRELVAGGGVYGFVDATVATLGFGFIFNGVGRFHDVPNLSDSVSPSLAGAELLTFGVTHLHLSLMLRYPFSLHERWNLFPMLGFDGQIALGRFGGDMLPHLQRVADRGYEVPTLGEFWNSMWFRFGAGADFALAGNLFLRGELLYGFKMSGAYESRTAHYWDRGVSNGLHVRIGVGYTFWRHGRE